LEEDVNPQSPSQINKHVRTLSDQLSIAADEHLLMEYVKPRRFSPELANCHLNSRLQAKCEGGSVQSGWMIAQDEKFNFAEAIFHTVWRTPEGVLRDVTPRIDGEERVMFIPDSQRTFTLTSYSERPAITTYSSLKIVGERVVEAVIPMLIILESNFAQNHGLWSKGFR
jgi:hypothetical protein